MTTPLFLIGYPDCMGGASAEAWHTLKLWRSRGVDVHLIPTWEPEPGWEDKTTAIGCTTHHVPDINRLGEVPGLAGAVCVVLCNTRFLFVAERFKDLGCRIVWVNCMTWLGKAERMVANRDGPFDAYVFQSEYQRGRLEPELADVGYTPDRGHLIHGAFDPHEFPYEPREHRPGEAFIVGRIGRAAKDKFSAETWATYDRINYRPLAARILGWNDEVEEKVGPPPDWAEVLPERAMSAREFYSSIHCLFHVTGGSRENWPRVGLEAMSAGVPVVAENDFGWPEMLTTGVTGYLGDTAHEMAHWAGVLAHDERWRLQLAQNARAYLETILADPDAIWAGWQRLLDGLGWSR